MARIITTQRFVPVCVCIFWLNNFCSALNFSQSLTHCCGEQLGFSFSCLSLNDAGAENHIVIKMSQLAETCSKAVFGLKELQIQTNLCVGLSLLAWVWPLHCRRFQGSKMDGDYRHSVIIVTLPLKPPFNRHTKNQHNMNVINYLLTLCNTLMPCTVWPCECVGERVLEWGEGGPKKTMCPLWQSIQHLLENMNT